VWPVNLVNIVPTSALYIEMSTAHIIKRYTNVLLIHFYSMLYSNSRSAMRDLCNQAVSAACSQLNNTIASNVEQSLDYN